MFVRVFGQKQTPKGGKCFPPFGVFTTFLYFYAQNPYRYYHMTLWLFIYLFFFVALQVVTGSGMDLRWMAFPLNGMVAVGLLALLFVATREWDRSRWMRSLRSPRMACRLLVLLTLAGVVGGLLPSGVSFSTSWPFVALLAALIVHLTLVLLHRLRRFSLKRDGAFLLVHGGLWLALVAGFVGAPDKARLRILASRDGEQSAAMDEQGRMVSLPYAMQLLQFHIECSEADGSPVQYRASVAINGSPVELSVNHPHTLGFGEDLYLMNFDPRASEAGGEAAWCVLLYERQPWQHLLLAGLLMLLAGVGWMLVRVK